MSLVTQSARTYTFGCIWEGLDSYICGWVRVVSWRAPPPSLLLVCRDSFTWVPWLVHVCAMTDSYVRYDSFIVTWLIHMSDMTWHMRDMTHWYVGHYSYMCSIPSPPLSSAWLSHVIHLDDSMSHVIDTNESWYTYDWVMSLESISHITRMTESCLTYGDRYKWVLIHIWLSHVTQINQSHHTYDWVMSDIWR